MNGRKIPFSDQLSESLQQWYKDDRLEKSVVNHDARGHIRGDLYRYLYYATYASVMHTSPNSHNLPEVLWPDQVRDGGPHRRVST